MSVFGAMFSGVSGLAAQSQAMAMIADNITNVNTVGYKETTARFSTLVTSAASATSYAPGGVQSSPLALIDRQGLLQASASPTDLAISGDGFFVVNELATPTATQGTYMFTRAGAFTADENGDLRNAAGHYLQGWVVDSSGNIPSNRSALTTLAPVNILGLSGTATASTSVALEANMQASQTVTVTGPQNVTNQIGGSGITSTAALSDGVGGGTITGLLNGDSFTIATGVAGPPSTASTTTFTYNATPSTTTFSTLAELSALVNKVDGLSSSIAGSSDSRLTVTGDPGSDMVMAEGTNTPIGDLFATAAGTITKTYDAATSAKNMASNTLTPDFERSVQIFDSKGGARQLTMGFMKQAFSNKWHVEAYIEPAGDTTATDGLLASGTISFNADGTVDLVNTSTALTAAISIPWAPTLGLSAQSVTLNFGTQNKADGLSQFDGPSQLKGSSVDGALFGELSTIQVDSLGFVTALFENGVTQKIYKLPVAMFKNPNGLSAKTGNAYISTDASGTFNLQEAGVGGSGQVAPSTLEASTVDIAKEFTNMILAQRAFSASSRIITTADDMLDELIRLKR
ncbi:MAG: flagellar hook-basal body complex protein [Alphaproteobacteria bacterium]|jgi:flagellar hook protein FlgE|nr:flagellar hook-basal body complex protein [Alphaproteobacteria bacterium]MBT4965466.1 flagellar hook-basal body complex protein [Alphaproteobacteria bacterium]MBT5918788.1 flagellar hook-basal body complex protein [Alphaproteobacteria bacterium]